MRSARDAAGKVTGVVERVRNGQKERFTALEEVGAVHEFLADLDAFYLEHRRRGEPEGASAERTVQFESAQERDVESSRQECSGD